MSNNRGHDFEEAIRQACLLYANQGRAKVEKTPELFRVLEKAEGEYFRGPLHRTRPAGLQGTLDGGRSIIFEEVYHHGRHETGRADGDTDGDGTAPPLRRAGGGVRGIQDRFFLRTVAGVAGHEGSLWAHERFGGGAGRLPRALHRGRSCSLDYVHKIGGPVDNRGRL